jgi:hypothetical protein
MRIVRKGDFVCQRWKNGGGITYEVAREETDDGALVWRLSMAEVGADGPFSLFQGLSRVLTVLDGGGMWLEHAGGRIDAAPLQPVAFSGDLAVHGRLVDGPVRDWNLIFDAARVDGAVLSLSGSLPPCPFVVGTRYALLCVRCCDDDPEGFGFPLREGEVALAESFCPMPSLPGFRGLLVVLKKK